jgi:hypothetical protein
VAAGLDDAGVDGGPDSMPLPDAPAGEFQPPRVVLNVNSTVDEFGPCVTGDELELWFTRIDAVHNSRKVLRSTRTTTAANFGLPLASPMLDGTTLLDISDDGLEALVGFSGSHGPEILVSTRPTRGADFGVPTSLFLGTAAKLSGDGLTLFYEDKLHARFTRVRPSKLDPWGEETALAVPELGTSTYSSLAVSRDGLDLLMHFPGDVNPAPDMVELTRTSTAATFSGATQLVSIAGQGLKTCDFGTTKDRLYCSKDVTPGDADIVLLER